LIKQVPQIEICDKSM